MEEGEIKELKESCKELVEINNRQENRVNVLESKAYLLATFFLFFQAIVLLVISQSTTLSCNKWWIPFTLSLLEAIVNGFALVHTIIKTVQTGKQLELNRQELHGIKRYIDTGNIREGMKIDQRKWHKRYIFITAALLILTAFTALILFACRSLLCDDEQRVFSAVRPQKVTTRG
eukprot:TRINITY_DN2206_c0_g1_i1.p1 TRINITY_DN2206_c0_g1~~TRINITY_DN2206_c0_g1_i1.p1  ORF type:complete len:175 (-),score=10.99 TRINITY_DN2206_c0_g1_i1:200-724(-)